MITKTHEEIDRLWNAIYTEMTKLPEFNNWGDSNYEATRELTKILDDLIRAKSGIMPDKTSDTYYWLTGNPMATLGKDYGIE